MGSSSERPWTVFQESDPLAQIRFDQSLDDHLGINSQQNPLGTGGTQSLESNGWQIEDVISLDNPDDVNGELDYRFLRPNNSREIGLVSDALLSTRLDFRRKMGCEAPETPKDECYAVQHEFIQNETWRVWLLDSEPPVLYSLYSWTGGFDNWHGLKILDHSSDVSVPDSQF